MGSILPKKVAERIAWFENHTPTWQTEAAAIGTTAGTVTSLQALTAAARAALTDQQSLADQTKAATLTLGDAVAAMTSAGADVLKQIKAKAAATGGNSVYALALIPAPGTPSPLPPPGTPANFTAALNPDGSLVLKWKCANPAGSQGTMYTVARRDGLSGEFPIIGATGKRSFVDPTVPAGTAAVTYKVTAVRSTVAGTAAEFLVNFGVGGGGAVTATVAPKLAA